MARWQQLTGCAAAHSIYRATCSLVAIVSPLRRRSCAPVATKGSVPNFIVPPACSKMGQSDQGRQHEVVRGPSNSFQSAFRTVEFWRRASGIYLAYKFAQGRARLMELRGCSPEEVKEVLWTPHHSWAGAEMYALAVDLRGFYLKASSHGATNIRMCTSQPYRLLLVLHDIVRGAELHSAWLLDWTSQVFQFIGARGDFVPEPICRKLSRLHDEVPPMPPHQVQDILQKELGVQQIRDVFEWIDLEKPLGSASLSQVQSAEAQSSHNNSHPINNIHQLLN